MKLTYGCDPELFLVNKRGSYKSAYGVIEGTKKNPFKVERGAYQVDGMAAEFNIDPAETEDEFVKNIQTVMSQLESAVGDLKFKIVDNCIFRDTVLETQPKEALELGCDPDFSAYTMAHNPMPIPPKPGFRTAAGHIHVGFVDNEEDVLGVNHMTRCQTLIKQMDRFVGLPLRLLEGPKAVRRQLYGRAGAFRPKPYGVEYRTPSNVWIKSEKLMRFAYKCTQSAVEELLDGYRAENDIKDYTIIDRDLAQDRYYANKMARLSSNTRLKSLFEEAGVLAEEAYPEAKTGYDAKAQNLAYQYGMAANKIGRL